MSIDRPQKDLIAPGDEARVRGPADRRLQELLSCLQEQHQGDLIVALPFHLDDVDLETVRGVAGIKALLIDGNEATPSGSDGAPRYSSQQATWRLPDSGARKIVFAGPWRRISMQMIGEARNKGVRSIMHRTSGGWTDSSLRSLVAFKLTLRAVLLFPHIGRWLLSKLVWLVWSVLLWAKRATSRVAWLRRLITSVIPYAAQVRLQQRLAALLGLPPTIETFRSVLADARGTPDYVKGRVVLACGSLQPGGAERQVVTTLLGLAQCRFESVRLFCDRLTPNHPERYDHFLPALTAAEIEARCTVTPSLRRRFRQNAELTALYAQERSLGPDLVADIAALHLEFRELKPEVVHAWLDWTNVRAGIAAVLAGVPKIIVSGRNINPSHFALHQEYMRPAYMALADHPNVVFLNNSRAGAVDYARWLDFPEFRIKVIYNGVSLEGKERAPRDTVATWRRELGIPADHAVVGSMFRLNSEKRPLLWVECAAAIAARRAKTFFVVCGQGALRDRMLRRARELGIDDRLVLIGVTDDVVTALSAMDVLLMTSYGEGTPNVALEAQWLGTPVVSTDTGGVAEAVNQGVTGFVADSEDPDVLAGHVLAFLDDPDRLALIRSIGKRFIGRHYGVSRMIRETVEVYGYTPESVGLVEDRSNWIRADAAVSEHRAEIERYLSTVPFTRLHEEILEAKEFSMLSWEVLALLHYFGRLAGGTVLELGPYLGGSTVALAKGAAIRDTPVITVEKGGAHDHPTLPSTDILGDLRRNLRLHGVSDRVCVVEGKSQDPRVIQQIRDAVDEHQIGLLVIDSDGHVDRDIKAFAPLCRPHCYIVIDDYVSADAAPKATLTKPYIDRMIAEGKLREFGVYGWGTWVGQLSGPSS